MARKEAMVTMSLEEYNEMMEEMLMLKKAFRIIPGYRDEQIDVEVDFDLVRQHVIKEYNKFMSKDKMKKFELRPSFYSAQVTIAKKIEEDNLEE